MSSPQSTATCSKKTPPKLIRTTFSTSRELDFFSEKELTAQTGHPIAQWPLVFAKEAIDNALDACEEADIAPQIAMGVDATGVTVTDNGPGIPEATIEGALDFGVRASSREQYVAPDRGAQGNAEKTFFGMAHVIDGKVIIVANGLRHEITCHDDPVTQRIVVKNDKTNAATKKGTTIRLEWAARKDSEGIVVWPFGNECFPLSEPDWDEPQGDCAMLGNLR